MQKGLLTTTTTLESALPTCNWAVVLDATDKKKITIAQMLSMSSGLTASCFYYGAQDTVEAALSSPTFSSDQIGRHNYLCSGSILSYVIWQKTGKTPLQFAEEELFPALGINRSVTWQPTYSSNGIQESGHGLVLGPIELAKLGQLYRQGGVTGAGVHLISNDFVKASSTDQLITGMPGDTFYKGTS